jgi:WhiB family redox-sensing transcriptional regulator
MNPDDFFDVIAAYLDRVELVPDDLLREIVTRDGSCMLLYRHDLEPEWTGNALTDRQLASRICADCPVQSECLELELRTSGEHALGVWGALPAEDVRALCPVWRARRRRRDGHTGDQASDQDGGQR